MKDACVGFLELSTIASGIQSADALLKKAIVAIVFAHPVSSGKYLIAFSGEVENVRSSLAAGSEMAASALIDSFLIPQIHPAIIPTYQQAGASTGQLEALGILETLTCARCIVAADAALKTSKVRLVKIELARGIGGKAYFVIDGEIGEIEAAMAAAIRAITQQGIIEHIIIPQAAPELLRLFP